MEQVPDWATRLQMELGNLQRDMSMAHDGLLLEMKTSNLHLGEMVKGVRAIGQTLMVMLDQQAIMLQKLDRLQTGLDRIIHLMETHGNGRQNLN